MTIEFKASKPLPDNRVREFSDMPGDRFYFEPGDVIAYRGEHGRIESVDISTRQLRLEGWERSSFVSWEKCRVIQTKDEVVEETKATADAALGLAEAASALAKQDQEDAAAAQAKAEAHARGKGK